MRKGLATIPEKLAALSPLFFPAPWVLFGPLLSDWAHLRDGAEAGVWGQENESPPSRGTEGSPELLSQCYKMLASCYENQAGIGSSWVASSRPPQPWASAADMEAMEAGTCRKPGHLHPRGLMGGSSCCPFPSSLLFLLLWAPFLGKLLLHAHPPLTPAFIYKLSKCLC